MNLTRSRYQRRCSLAGRADDVNFPHQRSSADQHFLNIRAMASQAFLDDQRDLRQVIAIGWSEDDCQGFKIIRVGMVSKDFRVTTKLLDLSVSSEKRALKKVQHAKAAIAEALNNCNEDVQRFCNLVKAGFFNQVLPGCCRLLAPVPVRYSQQTANPRSWLRGPFPSRFFRASHVSGDA